MPKQKVSPAVVRRLPRYFRHLEELSLSGVTRISSRLLAQRLGLTASQIRQDLNCFGGFGQQGYGYNVENLRAEIGEILGVSRGTTAVLIGVGNIGRALCNNFDFARAGVGLLAAFDVNPALVGQSLGRIPLLHIDTLDAFCAAHRPAIAVLTLPRELAPQMAERLSRLGVRGLWNFTNVDLHLHEHDVQVEDVHFADSLMTLCYRARGEEP